MIKLQDTAECLGISLLLYLWFEKVQKGEIENPYEFEHSNEPDWYKF